MKPHAMLATNLPARKRSFIGRHADFQILEKRLAEASQSSSLGPAACMMHGIGGQGKTQAALEYCWQHESSYYAAFWVNAADYQEAEKSYHQILKKLVHAKLLSPLAEGSEPDQAREHVNQWFEGTSKLSLLPK